MTCTQHEDTSVTSMKGTNKAPRKYLDAETLIRTSSHSRGGAIFQHYGKITVTNQNTYRPLLIKKPGSQKSGVEVLFQEEKNGIKEAMLTGSCSSILGSQTGPLVKKWQQIPMITMWTEPEEARLSQDGVSILSGSPNPKIIICCSSGFCVKPKNMKHWRRTSGFYFWEISILLITSHNLQGKGKDSREHGHPVSHCKGMENGIQL